MYIVIEGVVGTGKSTQSNLLRQWCMEHYPNREVLLVREPGATPIAEAIRMLVQATDFAEPMHPFTDVYLYAAARAQLIHSKIQPALERGAIVVSDRNVCSSLAYQGHAQGLGIQQVRDINEAALGNHLPDYIFFMDMDVAEGLRRTSDAAGDKRERQHQLFFEEAYAGYQQLADFAPLSKVYHRIDASGTKEDVFARLVEVLS